MTRYRYRPDVLAALAEHGVRPRSDTPPARALELVSDLYRFELRRLRDRLVRGEIRKAGYADHVVGLRRRYRLVSLRLEYWTESVEQ
jgi:hypothetical protein